MRNEPSAWEVILAVNARTVAAFNVKHRPGLLPLDHRCDMSRVGAVRRVWERVAEEYKRETGLDVREALKEHEAMLRDPLHAPQLHVMRRTLSTKDSTLT